MPVAYHNSQFKNWLSPYEFALRQIQQSSPVVSTKHENPNCFPVGDGFGFFYIKDISYCVLCQQCRFDAGCWHLFYFLFQFIELLCVAIRKLHYNLSEYR